MSGLSWLKWLTGAIVAIPVLIVLAMIGFILTIVPGMSQDSAEAETPEPSPAAVADIPQYMMDLYTKEDGNCGISWNVLAGLYYIESRHNANPGVSPAGAQGPGQFMPNTWAAYGVDGDGSGGPPDIMNPADAVPSTVNLLCRNGYGDLSQPANLRNALFNYNRSWAYVDDVLAKAAEYGQLATNNRQVQQAVGDYALPVDAKWLTPEKLLVPHHAPPAGENPNVAWDLGLGLGEPVYAMQSGTIIGLPGNGCGLGIEIQGDDGTSYKYCHGSSIMPNRAALGTTPLIAQRVALGEVVMLVGNTGRSTGPHLHLEMRNSQGVKVCPQSILPEWLNGNPISPNMGNTGGCVRGT